jgi:hypothetical protein
MTRDIGASTAAVASTSMGALTSKRLAHQLKDESQPGLEASAKRLKTAKQSNSAFIASRLR